MCKTFVAVALLAVVAIAHAGIPSAEEVKAELVAAGVSSTAADGIVAIGDKYKDQFAAAKSDHNAGKAAFEAFHAEVETYIKTQPEADQTAYAAFVEKKKAEHQGHHGHHSTPSD